MSDRHTLTCQTSASVLLLLVVFWYPTNRFFHQLHCFVFLNERRQSYLPAMFLCLGRSSNSIYHCSSGLSLYPFSPLSPSTVSFCCCCHGNQMPKVTLLTSKSSTGNVQGLTGQSIQVGNHGNVLLYPPPPPPLACSPSQPLVFA